MTACRPTPISWPASAPCARPAAWISHRSSGSPGSCTTGSVAAPSAGSPTSCTRPPSGPPGCRRRGNSSELVEDLDRARREDALAGAVVADGDDVAGVDLGDGGVGEEEDLLVDEGGAAAVGGDLEGDQHH